MVDKRIREYIKMTKEIAEVFGCRIEISDIPGGKIYRDFCDAAMSRGYEVGFPFSSLGELEKRISNPQDKYSIIIDFRKGL